MLAQIDWANVAVAFFTALIVAGGGAAFVIKISRQRDKSITQLETWRQIQTDRCDERHERIDKNIGKIFVKVDELAQGQAALRADMRHLLSKSDGRPQNRMGHDDPSPAAGGR